MNFTGPTLIAATGVHGPFPAKDGEGPSVTYPWATIIDLGSGDVFEKVTLHRDLPALDLNGGTTQGQATVELYKNNDGALKLRLLNFTRG